MLNITKNEYLFQKDYRLSTGSCMCDFCSYDNAHSETYREENI